MDHIQLLQFKEEYECLTELCRELTPYANLWGRAYGDLREALRDDTQRLLSDLALDQEKSGRAFVKKPPRLVDMLEDIQPKMSEMTACAYVPDVGSTVRLAAHFFQSLGWEDDDRGAGASTR